MLVLETVYEAGGDDGSFLFSLHNLGSKSVEIASLSLSTITRLHANADVDGATFASRFGNHHSFTPLQSGLAAGDVWRFSATGLTHPPAHCSDGPKSAYVTTADGSHVPVDVWDLQAVAGVSGPKQTHPATPEIPLLPWPAAIHVADLHVPSGPMGTGEAIDDVRRAMASVNALWQRLWPDQTVPFSLDRDRETQLYFQQTEAAGEHQISFENNKITVTYAGSEDLQHALITLAQIWQGKALPKSGQITDAPRFNWRGLHLDVVRHFRPVEDVLRILDIMAWLKLNIFQWHLTDDEGWRLDIPDLPLLTEIGGWRGPDRPILPQHGSGARDHGGAYSAAEIAEVVAHAEALHITVVPEIDIPGHCTAALIAYPELLDPDEATNSYFSVQGYPNNALNPGMAGTMPFLETVFAEVARLFPGPIVHVGGDEVDAAAWTQSPAAQALAKRIGATDAMGLQAHLMTEVQALLARHNKRLAGWDEVAKGGGVGRDALLVAWQSRETVAALLADGYEVIATPGQAYYLDMAVSDDWSSRGTSWAGAVPFARTYGYDPTDGLSADDASRIIGVQACIWSEHLETRAELNAMVFPRLGAIAEGAWSPPETKDVARAEAISLTLPKL